MQRYNPAHMLTALLRTLPALFRRGNRSGTDHLSPRQRDAWNIRNRHLHPDSGLTATPRPAHNTSRATRHDRRQRQSAARRRASNLVAHRRHRPGR